MDEGPYQYLQSSALYVKTKRFVSRRAVTRVVVKKLQITTIARMAGNKGLEKRPSGSRFDVAVLGTDELAAMEGPISLLSSRKEDENKNSIIFVEWSLKEDAEEREETIDFMLGAKRFHDPIMQTLLKRDQANRSNQFCLNMHATACAANNWDSFGRAVSGSVWSLWPLTIVSGESVARVGNVVV